MNRPEIVRAAFWAVRLDRHRPGGRCLSGYAMGELSPAAAGELAEAMGVRERVAEERFRHGARVWAARSPRGAIAAWLWVSILRERAEPIRRDLTFATDEAYGWSAGTRPEHRCQGLFTGLLEAAGAVMLGEGRRVMWNGIHDHNLASRRAHVRAGFAPVLRTSALVLGGRSLLRTRAADYADPELVARACRLLGGVEVASIADHPSDAPALPAGRSQRRNAE